MTASTVEGAEHEALFYTAQEDFLDGVLTVIRAGLAAGEPVLVAVPEPHLSTVRAAGIAGSAGMAGATLVDITDVGRNPNRILPWVLRSFADRNAPWPVRIVSEPIYVGRAPEEIAPCVQHEALINLAFAGRPVRVRCLYDAAQLPELLPYAGQTHPTVVDSSGRRASTNYTDPRTVVAMLNQPLPEPKRTHESIVFDIQSLAAVRRMVGKYADEAGLDTERTADLQMATNEVATNAVTHAPSGAATLRLWWDDDRIVCEVRGAGEISDIMAGRVIPDPDSPRGRGLLIANRLCDLVQTHTSPTGTVTRLHMRLSRS